MTGAPRSEPSRRPPTRRSPLHALRARSRPPHSRAALAVAIAASSTALALACLATPGARASRGICLGRASRCPPGSYGAPSGGVSEADPLDIKKSTKNHSTAVRLEIDIKKLTKNTYVMAERLERKRACLIPSQMCEEHLARLPGGGNTFTLLLRIPCCLHLGCPAIQSTCTYLLSVQRKRN